MPEDRERLRVLEDENGKRYAKQFTNAELQEHLAANPGHTVVR
tara:strand:- start:344 stop:472 length:129 start_codon:yes stop_codon:yes gene_type:complete